MSDSESATTANAVSAVAEFAAACPYAVTLNVSAAAGHAVEYPCANDNPAYRVCNAGWFDHVVAAVGFAAIVHTLTPDAVHEYEYVFVTFTSAYNTCVPLIGVESNWKYARFTDPPPSYVPARTGSDVPQYDVDGYAESVYVHPVRTRLIDGSTVTGNTVPGSARNAASGVNTRVWFGAVPSNATPTFAWCTGAPEAGSRVESHIRGVGEVTTTAPEESVPVNTPLAASNANVNPVAVNGNRTDPTPVTGRDFTTSDCSNPVASARTSKSTPDNTFAYVAVFPDRVGAGKLLNHPNTNDRPAPDTLNKLPADPPPDNLRPPSAAFGATDPSAAFTSVVSTGTHDPSAARTRTGAADNDEYNDPSGSTHVVAVSDRNPVTSTRCPDTRAATRADTTSGRVSGTAVAGAACAWARTGDTTTVSTPDTTRAAAVITVTADRHVDDHDRT